MEERQLQNYLQYVSETVYDSLTRWYFGHWHRDQEFGEKFRVVYLDLVDMERCGDYPCFYIGNRLY